MANVNLNNSAPAAPGGTVNVTWQHDVSGNVSGYVPTVAGPQGPAGASGANGNSVLNGSGAPSSSLGNAGDFYIDTAAKVIYGPKASGSWAGSGTSLIGPQGTTGATGPAGPSPSGSANQVLATPNGSSGTASLRALVAADVPVLNQNTTGTASNVTGTVAIANGGTGATAAAAALSNLVGAWQAWTPTITPFGSMTVTATIVDAQYIVLGALCYFKVRLSPVTIGGTASSDIMISLPVPVVGQNSLADAAIYNGSSYSSGFAYVTASGNSGTGSVVDVAQEAAAVYALNSTTKILVSGFYRVA
jgi:hypothetical protein